jgi:hypothetical protein
MTLTLRQVVSRHKASGARRSPDCASLQAPQGFRDAPRRSESWGRQLRADAALPGAQPREVQLEAYRRHAAISDRRRGRFLDQRLLCRPDDAPVADERAA